MKKLVMPLAVLAACILTATSSFAAGADIVINGYTCSFSASPILENGVVYVPVRGILEVLGAKVYWNDYSKTVTAVKGNKRIVMRDGTRYMTVDGKSVDMGGTFKLVNGVSMIPVRAVSEALGATVEYSVATGQVAITVLGNEINVNKLNTTVSQENNEKKEFSIKESSFSKAYTEKNIADKSGNVLAVVKIDYPKLSSSNPVTASVNSSIESFIQTIADDISEQNISSLTTKYKSNIAGYNPAKISISYEFGDIDDKGMGILFKTATSDKILVNTEYATIISFKDGSNSTLKNIGGLNEKTANNIVLNKFKELLSNPKAGYYKDAYNNVKSNFSKLNYFYKNNSVIVMADAKNINGKNGRINITIPMTILDDIKGDNINNKKYVLDAGLSYLSVDDYVKSVLLPYAGLLTKKSIVAKDGSDIVLDDGNYTAVRVKGYDGTVYDFALSKDYSKLKLYDNAVSAYKSLN